MLTQDASGDAVLTEAAAGAVPFGYLRRTHCPCCGTPSERSRLAFASAPPAEELPIDRHSDFAAGYTSERVFFSYFTCPECQARHCKTFYTEEQLLCLYQEQVENMGQVPLPARQRAQNDYAARMLKHVRAPGAFLEIGPDIGLFAEYCAGRHSFDHYWMLEPNRVVHEELRTRLSGQPLTIKEDMWPTDDIAAGSVAATALIHVLDHLLDPLAFLQSLHAKLAPGGVIMTVTHNSQSALARLLGRRWPPHALQHPQLYNPSSITRLYRRAGFEIEEIAPAMNHFPIGHLARAAFAIIGMGKVLPEFMGPIIPISLGNIAVVARKSGN
ncbi:class I SAM-dependent methyltransferase [Bosea sp. R86505]|uniref:class I SAM-dependent methyltransferase n=1 Tax=Bosea sp. R86505 TaxID=3101710 RepID=UPI00366B597B